MMVVMKIDPSLFEFMQALGFVSYERQDKRIDKYMHQSSSFDMIQFIDSTVFYLRGRAERISHDPNIFPIQTATIVLPQLFMRSWIRGS
jgi:hypothetical protein